MTSRIGSRPDTDLKYMNPPGYNEPKASLPRKQLRWYWPFVVLAIAGIFLWNVIMPQLGTPPGSRRAPVKAAITQIGAFGTTLDVFKADNGFYPKGKDGLKDLVQRPAQATTDWHEYLDHVPLDPWGHAYIYECPGSHRPDSYDLSSAGPDGRAGTADDITNWQPTGH